MEKSSLIIFVSLLNIVLALIIFVNNIKSKNGAIYLSFFLVIYSINNIANTMIFFGGSVFWLAILLNNFAPLYFLHPVMIYLFYRSMYSGKSQLKKTDIIHFIPFIINFLCIIPYIITPFEYKYSVAEKVMCNVEEYIKFDLCYLYPNIINIILRPLQFILYMLFCLYYIIKINKRKKKKYIFLKTESLFSLSTLISMVIVVISINVSQIPKFYNLIYKNEIDQFLFFLQNLYKYYPYLYLILPIYLLFNQKILYGVSKIESDYQTTDNVINNVNQTYNDTLESKNEQQLKNINENYILLTENILKYLEEEKPFLNPDFSLLDICVKLNVPLHQIQFCFNTIMRKKFSEIKNEKRVEYALELLKTDNKKKLTLESIGHKAGFSSNSNFYMSFRKVTGKTPNEWIKENKKSDIENNQ